MDVEIKKKWLLGCIKYYKENVTLNPEYWNKWINGCLNKYNEYEKKRNTSTEEKNWGIDIERVLFSLNRRL